MAAEERIKGVLTAIRVVLLQSILQNVLHEMLRVTFVGKPDTMSRRAGVAEQQVGGRVGLIHKNGTEGELVQNDPEENVSKYGSSVGWVTDSNAVTHGWLSNSSTDYVVMSARRKQEEELKVAGAKLALRINGHATQAWIDSGSPISIFTLKELKCTIGIFNVRLQQLDSRDDQFRDYGNNPLKPKGKMVVTLQSNGWTTKSTINVIGGCRPSISGQDLIPELGLMLVQAPAEHGVHKTQKQGETAAHGDHLDDWQKLFSKQFCPFQ